MTDQVEAKAPLPIFTRGDVAQFAYQAGFQQVEKGVEDAVNEFFEEELTNHLVSTSVINAAASREKSLRAKHANDAIRANPLIPQGHYV